MPAPTPREHARAEAWTPPKPPSIVVAIVALAIVALGIGAVASRVTSFSTDQLARNDFTQDYVSARAWTDDVNPYAPTAELADRYLAEARESVEVLYEDRRNPHPPLQIVLARPFASLSYRTARIVWLALMSLLIAVAVAITLLGLGARRGPALVAGTGSLALPIVQQDMIWVQINGLILILLVSGWWFVRLGAEARAGIALGFATALKIYPIIFVIPLLRMKRLRAAAWQIGTAATVGSIGVLAVGLSSTSTYFSEASPANYEYWRSAPMNVSLVSMPFRWLTTSVWRLPSINLPAAAIALAIVIGLACLVAAARTPARASRDVFWAATPWMLLATPLAWSFTLSLMLPLLACLMVQGSRSRGLPHPVLLVAMLVLVITPFPGLPVPGPANSVLVVLVGFGLPTYALLWLGASEWIPGFSRETPYSA